MLVELDSSSRSVYLCDPLDDSELFASNGQSLGQAAEARDVLMKHVMETALKYRSNVSKLNWTREVIPINSYRSLGERLAEQRLPVVRRYPADTCLFGAT